MEEHLNEVNMLEKLKSRFKVSRPESIRERVAEWAFDDADDSEAVIRKLEQLDCAACYSPAPIHYHVMAAEIAERWPEIDDAMDGYRDATGEAWTPKKDQNFLTYLWFAYEWTASELASEIRNLVETVEEAD